MITPLGAFDPDPSPGQTIIPRSFARGPAFFSVNLSASRTIKFGRAIEPKTPPPGAERTTTVTSDAKPPQKPPMQRPYSLTFFINAANIFNRTNRGAPVGNMSSPFFLESPSGSNTFFFGPGGGSGGNRTITLRIRIGF